MLELLLRGRLWIRLKARSFKGTRNAVRLNDLFDAFQMVGQVAKVALRPFALLARFGHLNGV